MYVTNYDRLRLGVVGWGCDVPSAALSAAQVAAKGHGQSQDHTDPPAAAQGHGQSQDHADPPAAAQGKVSDGGAA